ncbi:hypothetical protein ACMYL6_23695, partial [Salmonella enterica subsp. enterica serovar Infantis]|uniref:hypothetical protein n=1 Tax=Salmonella enterica TaxID=28901 RepID=UPI0039E8990D
AYKNYSKEQQSLPFRSFHLSFKDLLIFIYMSTLQLSSCTPEEYIGSYYRWLGATMWLQGIELRTSGRAVSALNC